MTVSQRNRGKEASDDRLFSPKAQRTIQTAVEDLCFLYSRGYAEKSALQLVGNRHKLNRRQQRALQGMAASKDQLARRSKHQIDSILGKTLSIDGFNLLIILESALSGAYIFKGMDGCYRDLSGVHGTYKRVQQTEKALLLVGDALQHMGIAKANWYFDSPVSNSGRLKTILYEIAGIRGYAWDVFLDFNPDKVLAEGKDVVVSSDAWILDRAEEWYNLAEKILAPFQNQITLVNACN